ncbi:hypothetical protein [Paenibacillus sp. OAS669]|uniref:hypothetical protein n=1 Tax=Paenibacillus sp. OAS669 TaxID=2663821 RepID=UPI0017897254|nr:hypothetical protein [Paenibacillus sp. OAS669]MBE1446090.1 hypothetical protein [Paenibacillus sp. OAS669]
MAGNKSTFKIFSNEDQIFIGEILSSPAIGKMFSKKSDYLSCINEFKKSIKYFGLANQNKNTTAIFVLKGHVEVEIIEKEDCVFINVTFINNNTISGFLGLTDTKGFGFEKFNECYKQKPHVLVSLICNESQEETLIFGVNNVKLTTL